MKYERIQSYAAKLTCRGIYFCFLMVAFYYRMCLDFILTLSGPLRQPPIFPMPLSPHPTFPKEAFSSTSSKFLKLHTPSSLMCMFQPNPGYQYAVIPKPRDYAVHLLLYYFSSLLFQFQLCQAFFKISSVYLLFQMSTWQL